MQHEDDGKDERRVVGDRVTPQPFSEAADQGHISVDQNDRVQAELRQSKSLGSLASRPLAGGNVGKHERRHQASEKSIDPNQPKKALHQKVDYTQVKGRLGCQKFQ